MPNEKPITHPTPSSELPSHASAKKALKQVVHHHHGIGHMSPREQTADDMAFFSGMHSSDAFAEQLGESFVRAAISGEDDGEDLRDQRVTEEIGGPFVETTSEIEVSLNTDASNPVDATREPFPRT